MTVDGPLTPFSCGASSAGAGTSRLEISDAIVLDALQKYIDTFSSECKTTLSFNEEVRSSPIRAGTGVGQVNLSLMTSIVPQYHQRHHLVA